MSGGRTEGRPERRGGDRGHVVGTRRDARERALSLLYEAETKGVRPAQVLDELPLPPDRYTAELVVGVDTHGEELDDLIRRFTRGWALERMPMIDRNLLRLGIFELAHQPDVPTGVAISEAVELATQFSTDESGRFVNGMLARIGDELRGSSPGWVPPADGGGDGDDGRAGDPAP